MRRKRRNTFKRTTIIYVSLSVILLILFLFFNIDSLPFIAKPAISPLAAKKDVARQVDKASIEFLLSEKEIAYKLVTTATDSAYLVVLEDGSEVLFSTKKDIVSQISSLQLILGRFTIEGKRLMRIDFRHKNPIIVLKN